MVDMIYVEEAVAEHPRTRRVLERFPRARVVPCERYGEVFNRRAQSFRLQKRRPALILAKKGGRLLLEAPAGYGIGARRNLYFSHMLNCVYDCRYCFLQGMYRSAHYVLFVNFEDFQSAIDEEMSHLSEDSEEEVHFFSGYDCDSLAFDAVTGFVEDFLPLFERQPRALLELRTKSVAVDGLLGRPPVAGCIVAYSLTPSPMASTLEHGAPSVERRLRAMERLQGAGWRLGLRFDPVIYHPQYLEQYRQLFAEVFDRLRPEALHSVSLGPFRLPDGFFRTMVRHYPEEPLFAGDFESSEGMTSYRRSLEEEMIGEISDLLLRHIPREIYFPCPV